jgi:hypothetical protein
MDFTILTDDSLQVKASLTVRSFEAGLRRTKITTVKLVLSFFGTRNLIMRAKDEKTYQIINSLNQSASF